MKEIFLDIPKFDSHSPFYISMAGISYRDRNYKIERKCSDTSLVEYVISGTGTIKTENKIYHPKAGDSYILSEGKSQYYYSDSKDPWVKIWVNFSGSFSRQIIDAYGLSDTVLFHCDTREYIEKMHRILQNKGKSPKELLNEAVIVFHQLIQYLSENSEKQINIPKEAEILKDYIDTNFYSEVSLKTLSSLIFKSPSQTIRIFKKHFGMTPYEYCTETRIKKARLLLKQTNCSVKEVAFRLGFCDEHYFSNLFHKKTGMKPSEYRNSNT